MNKTFKIHLSQKIKVQENKITQKISFFQKIVAWVFLICFKVGTVLINLVLFFIKLLNYEKKNTLILLKKIKQTLISRNFYKSNLFFLFIVCVCYGFFGFLVYTQKLFFYKNSVLSLSQSALDKIGSAKKNIFEGKTGLANEDLYSAYDFFSNADKNLEKLSYSIGPLAKIVPKINDGENLLSAAQDLVSAGQDFIFLSEQISDLKISQSGIVSSGAFKEKIEVVRSQIQKINKKISVAVEKIQSVNEENIPEENREFFINTKKNLLVFENSITNFKDISEILFFTMEGKRNILILLLNNNELRPTGGFIGSLADISMLNGKIDKLKISSVYDYDGQLSEIINPPSQVFNVNNRWYLRDSNWFADYPTSATKSKEFFEKEGGETPDLIVSLTPDLFVDFLKIFGKIEVTSYGLELNSENFIEKTQIATSATEEGDFREKKQILSDFLNIFIEKINSINKQSLPDFFKALQKNLNSKNIILYSRDNKIQSILEKYNWAGKIQDSELDYLSVVSANLNGTKTDRYIDQEIELKTTVNIKGEIFNDLKITRTNRLPSINGSENLSYIRVLVPKDSELVENSGFDKNNLEPTYLENSKNDKDVEELEKNSFKELKTGTVVGKESGKTSFGNWLLLKGMETKVIKLKYRLPFKANDVLPYNLVFQKQPGTLGQSFKFMLEFPGRISIWNSENLKKLNNYLVAEQPNIESDSFYSGLIIKNND